MMVRYFADTFYFLALLCASDDAHAEAVELARRLSGQLVTTDAVVLEVADALSAPGDRERAAVYIRALWQEPRVDVRRVERPLLERGLDLYASRRDKDWGLTDCISFVVMREEGIEQALTGDSHFTQAGFTILFSG